MTLDSVIEYELNISSSVKVTENVITYQLDRYAKERGIDLREISYEERLNLTDKMINKSYPGDIAS